MKTQLSHIPWVASIRFYKKSQAARSKIWYFLYKNIHWNTEKVTDYIINYMICCNATLQKVKANFRKTITLPGLKEKQHRNYYKIKCFCTELWIKAFSSSLIHYFFKGGVEEHSKDKLLSFCFYCRTPFNKLTIEYTLIRTKHYQTYVLTLV